MNFTRLQNWIRIRYLKLLLKTQHKIGLQNRQLKPEPVQSLSFLKKDPDSSTESFLAPRGAYSSLARQPRTHNNGFEKSPRTSLILESQPVSLIYGFSHVSQGK